MRTHSVTIACPGLGKVCQKGAATADTIRIALTACNGVGEVDVDQNADQVRVASCPDHPGFDPADLVVELGGLGLGLSFEPVFAGEKIIDRSQCPQSLEEPMNPFASLEGSEDRENPTPICLSIEGMMCQKNCGSTVQRVLGAVPGVTQAQVSFPEKMARVWGRGGLNATHLIEAVESVGFEASKVPDFVLDVEGMMCQKNCGSTVQGALEAVHGVTEANVSFAEKQARVWATPEVCAVDLVDAVESVGFGASISPDAVLAVEGMMCQKNCGSTVQQALEGVTGVTKAKVSFAEGRAWVWAPRVQLQDLILAVESVGYGAEKFVKKDAGDMNQGSAKSGAE
ncbi:unnamed protein product, partial [Choristocarpus tenellus]